MLEPDYLINNLGDITTIYADLHTSILASIAKHVADTLKTTGEAGVMPSLKKQIEHAQAAGLLREDIIQHIADTIAISDVEVRALFQDAGVKSLAYDNRVYTEAGLKPVAIAQSPTMLKVLEAGITKQNGSLRRLTGTVVANSEQLFERTLNAAYNKVVSGTHSYTEALREGIDDMTREGVKAFHYASGRAISIEAGLLMNLRTGIAQTAAHITEQGIRERGVTHVEVSAHISARTHPSGDHRDHQGWQGRIFSFSERKSDPKNNGNHLQNHENSDILKSRGSDLINVTDKTISDVPRIKSDVLSEHHWGRLQEEHKSLLELVRNQPLGTECARVFDLSMSKQGDDFIGPPGGNSVTVKNFDTPHIVIHNHADGAPISLDDFESFLRRPQTFSVQAISNGGAVSTLEKLPLFSAVDAIHKYNRTVEGVGELVVKGASQTEVESAIESFLYSLNENGFIYRRWTL